MFVYLKLRLLIIKVKNMGKQINRITVDDSSSLLFETTTHSAYSVLSSALGLT